jgi:hypothetical protein
MKKEVKNGLLLLAFVIMMAIIIRTLSGGETLADLEKKTPKETVETIKEPTIEDTIIDYTTTLERVYNAHQAATEAITSYLAMQVIPEKIEPDPVELEAESIEASRTTYQEGFYYEPLSEEVKTRITGISYPTDSLVPYEDLRYVKVLHYNFDGILQEGELICNQAIAQDMVEIFYELYLANYKIAKMILIDAYGADDNLSMEDNNTSAFNYRVVSGTSRLSKHAYGLAIDINPMQNPFVDINEDGSLYSSPAGSDIYADRTVPFDHKIDEQDLCYQLFIEHGFIWGGHWNSYQDYQHFQKEIE